MENQITSPFMNTTTEMEAKKKAIEMANALEFMTAGKAKFTLQSNETHKHFTYRVTKPKNQRNPATLLYFVGLLTGTDNESQYSYIGTLQNKEFRHGTKSKITADAQGVKAFDWFLRHLVANSIKNRLTFYHEGCCCRCGRTLTHPESIKSGVGPECIKLMNKSNNNN